VEASLPGAAAIRATLGRDLRAAAREPGVWLTAAVIVVTVRALARSSELAWITAFCFALGALALVILPRALTLGTAQILRVTLVTLAAVQTPLLLWEWWTAYPVGLMGVTRFTAALIAVAVPLAPWGVLPVLAIGLALTQSYLAIVAAAIGFIISQPHQRRSPIFLLSGTLGALALVGWLVATRSEAPSLLARLEVWALVVPDLAAHPILGLGPGGWGTTIPLRQIISSEAATFAQAHSELVGWIVEEGLLGLVLLAGWLYAAGPPLWRSDVRGAVVAIAILAAGLHVFHTVTLAPWLILVLGMGLRPEASRC
jgi:hypothetical protein